MGLFRKKDRLSQLILDAGRCSSDILSNERALERWRGIRERMLDGRDIAQLDADTKKHLADMDDHIRSLSEGIERQTMTLQKLNLEIRDESNKEEGELKRQAA